MKKNCFALPVALLVCLCLPLTATARQFTHFNIDVPAGWNAREEGNTVLLLADDQTCSISLTVGSGMGHSMPELADGFLQELDGYGLEQDEDGDYVFQFENKSGVGGMAFLMDIEDGDYLLMVITGEHKDAEKILASIE